MMGVAHLHQGPDAFTLAFLYVRQMLFLSTSQATGPLGVSRCPETSSAGTGGRSSQRPPVVVRDNLQQDNRGQELGRLQQLHKQNMGRLRNALVLLHLFFAKDGPGGCAVPCRFLLVSNCSACFLLVSFLCPIVLFLSYLFPTCFLVS